MRQQKPSHPKTRLNILSVSFAALFLFLFLGSTAVSAHGLSSVSIGAGIQFRIYTLVGVVGQYLPMETKPDAAIPFDIRDDENGKILIVQ